mmetsp:Transcript_399/g.375  ORF Transcript_399/g.375 Transcript_399/m.375 type:complete len:118 (+) Transcript_399:665-1018(+)
MTAGYYIVAGGLDLKLNSPTNRCYFYYDGNNEAEKIDKMDIPRYSFNLISVGEFAYAVGGKTSNPDGSVTLLKSCERFDCGSKKWVQIADLNKARSDAMTIVIKSKMYVLGGCDEQG